MKNIVSKFNVAVGEVKQTFLPNILNHLENIDYNDSTKDIQIYQLRRLEDLTQIYTGTGFYIILTDYPSDNNNCTLYYKGAKAIYRGHSYGVRDRIKSHLFNEKYNEDIIGKKYSTKYTVCLKMEDGNGGINIDSKIYSKWNWFIIIHKMNNSSKTMRELMEDAFDEIYNRPVFSRENRKSKN